MNNSPDYDISIRDNGEIVIMRNSDFATLGGNYNTDDKFKEFCDALSLKSSFRKVTKEKDNPLFEVKTEISSVEKDENGITTINVPQNPFLSSFSVKHEKFEFSEGQNIWYKDSNPPEMLIGGPEASTTIVKHHQMGWVSGEKYEYLQLNEASRAVYDQLIEGTNHRSLCSYLQDVEKIYNGEDDSFLLGKSMEYREKATALADEYKNISKKSMLRKGEFCLMHPDDVKDSDIMTSVKKYIPSHIATSVKSPNMVAEREL